MIIKISCSKDTPENLLKAWADENLELKGKAFMNKQTGIIGIFISPINKSAETIDIFYSLDDTEEATNLLSNENVEQNDLIQ